ncbi:phosphoribosyltransferase family protein [Candidatus Flexifilum breve]|uniref:phosphoribosyltransferase n=1 Tax=Candidatus Flexifilum breve TaxID=3140694 RepID=UPI0031CC9C99
MEELGEQISNDYAGAHNLLLICILKGGVMFTTDPMRSITVPHEIDFSLRSSYGRGARMTTGSVRIDMDLKAEVIGKHVLIVEDIIDRHTLKFVMEVMSARQLTSVRLCTLLISRHAATIDIKIDYTGFTIEDKLVFGYGPDLDEKYRNFSLSAWSRAGSGGNV